MLESLSPPRRRLLLTVITGLALAALVVGLLVVRVAGGADPAEQDQPGPVLVVPGYGGSLTSLDPLVAELGGEGREVVVVRPSGGGTGDLRMQAERLGVAAKQELERTGAASVDVVGYSAGGVIARLWVRDGGGDMVRRVLTLGSPQHGTDVAALAAEVAGGCPQACEQLGPDSDLLRELNAGDETPAGPVWITIRSSGDQVVTPADSASLDGALNLLVQDVCPGAPTSHSALPGDPVVLAALPVVLGTGPPRAPRDVSC
ncbi:MAG: lipase [Actinomycetota bacterium]|nr:lipase [Actinomycetota bacterium]